MRILTNYDLRKCKICGDITHPVGKRKSDGMQRRIKDLCTKHHQENLTKKHGKKSYSALIIDAAGFATVSDYNNHNAKQAGFDGYYDRTNHNAKQAGFKSQSDRLNKKHPYRKYRKDYCENIDGRLGFKCSISKKQWLSKKGEEFVMAGMLEVDHIIPRSKWDRLRPQDPAGVNTEENTQTLCCNCHKMKGWIFEDGSPKSEVVMELAFTKKKTSIKYARQKNEPWRMLEERCIEKESMDEV